MNVDTAIKIANVFLVLAGIAAAIFPIMYARSPWYDSTVGRDTMTFSVCLVVIIALLLAVRVFGLQGPPRAVLAMAIYISLAFLFWRRVWVLWRIQRDPWQFARRDEERQRRRERRRGDREARRTDRQQQTTPTSPPED